MALHNDFLTSPRTILDPAMRWFPAHEALRATSMDKLNVAAGGRTTQKGQSVA